MNDYERIVNGDARRLGFAMQTSKGRYSLIDQLGHGIVRAVVSTTDEVVEVLRHEEVRRNSR